MSLSKEKLETARNKAIEICSILKLAGVEHKTGGEVSWEEHALIDALELCDSQSRRSHATVRKPRPRGRS